MKLIQLKRINDDKVIYEGRYNSIRACVEDAIRQGETLDYIDLSGANLVNASLDGAKMRGASLKGANLSGANLSEADFRGSNFSEASLYNACFCWSNLASCNFHYAGFGATDISGAILNCCRFAGLSTFSLSFGESLSMKDCRYTDMHGRKMAMNSPPLVIGGLERSLAVIDEDVIIGNTGISQGALTDEPYGIEDLIFLRKYREIVSQIVFAKNNLARQPKVVDKCAEL
jgi:hypothetical protein